MLGMTPKSTAFGQLRLNLKAILKAHGIFCDVEMVNRMDMADVVAKFMFDYGRVIQIVIDHKEFYHEHSSREKIAESLLNLVSSILTEDLGKTLEAIDGAPSLDQLEDMAKRHPSLQILRDRNLTGDYWYDRETRQVFAGTSDKRPIVIWRLTKTPDPALYKARESNPAWASW